MQGEQNIQTIPLGGLANLFDEPDRKSVFLVDTVGNSYTFFKYKAKLIDVLSLFISVGIGQKSKEEAHEQIRKGFLFGLNRGESTIFHIGEKNEEIDEFMKGAVFWEPKMLFKPPNKITQQWYETKVRKPTDKDIFGNEGTMLPSDKYRTFISTSKERSFSDIKWLKGLEEDFCCYKIQ